MFRSDLELREEACKILKKLIRTKSVNTPGDEMDVVKLILSYFEGYDVKYTILDHGNNRGSLILEIPGEDNSSPVAFIGHIDTVPIGDEGAWKYPPFQGVVEGDYMYGRGTSDMKGGVCAMILTAKYLLQNKNKILPPRKIYFCFTADEEKDGMGIMAIKKAGIINDVKEIIIAEPSCLKLGICEKGALWLNIKVRGKEAHASMPHLGINAIEIMVEFIKRLKESIDMDSFNKYLGHSTVAVTKIEGGVKTNIIPAFAEASVDIRAIPGIINQEVLEKAEEIAKSLIKEKDVSIELEVENNRPALEIEEEHEFLNKFKDIYSNLNYKLDYKGINFYTDASQIIPDLDMPFVILGPGDDSLAHQRNERIEISTIPKAVEIYINYIMYHEKK